MHGYKLLWKLVNCQNKPFIYSLNSYQKYMELWAAKTKFIIFPFPNPNGIIQALQILEFCIHGKKLWTRAYSTNFANIFYVKLPLKVFNFNFHHPGSSLAPTILSQEHQERWGHSGGSAATESKVQPGRQILWWDNKLAGQLWAFTAPSSPSGKI